MSERSEAETTHPGNTPIRESMRRLARALETAGRVRTARGNPRRDSRLKMELRDQAEPLNAEQVRALADLIESLSYAVDDAQAEARANLQVTSRTITHAMRHPRF